MLSKLHGKEVTPIKNLFKRLFSPNKGDKKKRVIAFVDFEHWYISLERGYRRKPDVVAFRDELADRYEIVDIKFFGDFSNPGLRGEISNIRRVSNTIIDTQNASDKVVKDFTDFIILDHIYQSAMDRDAADAYVLFTGDGHFYSAASFLVTKCRKEVGIYAVRGAASTQLMSCGTYTRLVPDEEKKVSSDGIEATILRNLRDYYNKNKRKNVHLTFWATVEAVVKHHGTDREKTAEALRTLIAEGYVTQDRETIGKKSVKVLHVDWNKVSRDGIL